MNDWSPAILPGQYANNLIATLVGHCILALSLSPGEGHDLQFAPALGQARAAPFSDFRTARSGQIASSSGSRRRAIDEVSLSAGMSIIFPDRHPDESRMSIPSKSGHDLRQLV